MPSVLRRNLALSVSCTQATPSANALSGVESKKSTIEIIGYRQLLTLSASLANASAELRIDAIQDAGTAPVSGCFLSHPDNVAPFPMNTRRSRLPLEANVARHSNPTAATAVTGPWTGCFTVLVAPNYLSKRCRGIMAATSCTSNYGCP